MEFRTAGVIFSVVIACIYKVSNGNDDLTITYGQKLILDKFKETVVNKLPHDYMKQDVYLIRWLRARSFNLKESERMLMENIKWRQTNNIDNILNEQWADMEVFKAPQFRTCILLVEGNNRDRMQKNPCQKLNPGRRNCSLSKT